MVNRTTRMVGVALCLAMLATSVASVADVIPGAVPDLPVLGAQALRGQGLITTAAPDETPTTKTIDGEIGDWVGEPTHYAGTSIYDAGEYVYSDHLMDDWGADAGPDATRAAIVDPIHATEPRTYRTEALAQALGDQFDAPGPPEIAARGNYGEAAYPASTADQADIVEARVAADANRVTMLVRTQSMAAIPRTAILVLVDTEPGGTYTAPGGITTAAEYSFLVNGGNVLAASDRGTAAPTSGVTVASNGAGYVNAVEIAIDRAALGSPSGNVGVALAAGVVNTPRTSLAPVAPGTAAASYFNVAFRGSEPTRVWMEHDQALALFAGNIDRFLASIDLAKLEAGATETFVPRPGYWERIYESDSVVNQERESKDYFQGPFQQYGVYIPTTYRAGTPTPATFWLHFNGGHAHDAAALVPGLIRQLGEQRGNIVISPGVRGTTSGYTGRGLVDFLEVFDDATNEFSIDRDRVYLTGYSFGGFAVYLYGLLMPDLFAAAFPTVGPAAARDPAFVVPITPLDELMTLQSVIENARNLPFVIYQGTGDEIIPYADVARQAARFTELGYRHRFHSFPGYEHYSFAVTDQWEDAAGYMDGFRRDPNPERVTYKVWPAMEALVNTDNTPVPLDYRFDRAYWASELTVRDGDPSDPATMGTFDARTFGRGADDTLALPDAGVGVSPAASAITGIQWLTNGRLAARNGFEVSATNLAVARVDLARMGIGTVDPIEVGVTTDGPVELRLEGPWLAEPGVTGATIAGFDGTTLRLTVPAGVHNIILTT
jgi:poly(3-hydroxybutyrate) depolymerase